ncbi:MAG: IS1595 family transposase [Verrucomicrobiota bacterium]|jgi:transposase-like protein
MKNILDFKTLAEFIEHFKDEETCRAYFTAIRFRNGEYCPHCGHREIYKFADGKRYRCAGCKEDFTIKTGSVFGESKLPLKKWFIAIYLLFTTSKGISSVQLAKHVGVTQKTGWFMDHRLRSAMKQNKGQLFGTIEVDETYVGGLVRNMHRKKVDKSKVGTGGKGKSIVFGMRQRRGQVRARVIENNDAAQLHPAIQATVAPGSTIYTDEHRGYNGLMGYIRTPVNHSAKIYVDGDAHTNGIESFWALFKRGYHGVYHQMSKKHLQKYVDECAYRLNQKGQPTKAVFADVVQGTTDGKQLPYKQLIA